MIIIIYYNFTYLNLDYIILINKLFIIGGDNLNIKEMEIYNKEHSEEAKKHQMKVEKELINSTINRLKAMDEYEKKETIL